ncbi:MAG: hypothetical protein ABFC77_04120 [Thermoguttaceae bacterium]
MKMLRRFLLLFPFFLFSFLCESVLSGDATSQKPDGPQAMFSALGVGPELFRQFVDGKPIASDKTEPLLRVLYRLRWFPAVDLDRWANEPDAMSDSTTHPDRRGAVFRLRGRVLQVELQRPSAQDAERFEMTRYYRCRLQLDNSPNSATSEIYTENVPPSWRDGATPDVPGGALGVLLKAGLAHNGHLTWIFVAPRLAWYPDDPLGRLGMDFGLLESMQNEKPFDPRSAADSEAFYQMLAAVGRAKPGRLLRDAKRQLPNIRENWRWTNRQGQEQYSVVPLFTDPDSQVGRLMEFSGTARRVERIAVDDPDLRARFGIDHYFQVSLLTDDSQGNPLTFCVREIPQGMPYGAQPHYGEWVQAAGFFFKTWIYTTAATAASKTTRQPSPLLIGRDLAWRPVVVPPRGHSLNAALIIAALAMMGLFWWMAWRGRRREQQWLARQLAEKEPIEEKQP